MSKEPITECPHCHCDPSYGYYRNVYIKGHSICRYKFDGSDGDNTDMNQYLDYKEYKTAYCCKCDKKINI